jgi:hypothetical protein
MGPTDSLSENILKGVFSTDGLSNYLHEVETLQRTVEDDARAADAQCILLIPLELQCRIPNRSYVGTALRFDEHSSKY